MPNHRVAESEPTNGETVPGHIQLVQMATGCWISQLISAAANLSIADQLADGPKSASEIAEAVRCNPRAVHRFMRALANFGILTSAGEQKFALTPAWRGVEEQRLRSGSVNRSYDGGTVDVEVL